MIAFNTISMKTNTIEKRINKTKYIIIAATIILVLENYINPILI